jgi:bacterioferritin
MKEAVIAELVQHATDELRHAGMIAGRIIQLGGTPVTEPKWYDVTSCGYDAPDDPFVKTILDQNIRASVAPSHLQKALGGNARKGSGDLQHRLANPAGRGRARRRPASAL